MNKVLAIWNIILTVILIGVLTSKFSVSSGARAAETSQVVRTTRLEVVDQNGKTKAVLGIDGSRLSSKALPLQH